MHKSSGSKKRVFTLVELVLILVIIGVSLTFVFHSIIPTSTVELEAAANKLFLDLQYAQNLALSTSVWCGVVFMPDPVNTYRLLKSKNGKMSAVEDPSNIGRDFVVKLYDIYKGVAIQSVDINGGESLWFHPLGTPHSADHGQVMAMTGVVTLEYSGAIKTIMIDPSTGRIKIF
ncbi:MAG: hypothetical protein ABIH69_00345 [bacterium]|nr:hypothetical protein [Candidatus Margulisiibacteriota bacterium]